MLVQREAPPPRPAASRPITLSHMARAASLSPGRADPACHCRSQSLWRAMRACPSCRSWRARPPFGCSKAACAARQCSLSVLAGALCRNKACATPYCAALLLPASSQGHSAAEALGLASGAGIAEDLQLVVKAALATRTTPLAGTRLQLPRAAWRQSAPALCPAASGALQPI